MTAQSVVNGVGNASPLDGGVVVMSKQTMRQAARLAASQAQAARVRADRDRRLEKLVVV